jgi:outer membrane protein TolC
MIYLAKEPTMLELKPQSACSLQSATLRIVSPRSFRLLSIVIAASLAGCAVTPTQLTQDDVKQRVAEDKRQMFVGQEPIKGPLTFAEIAARALKYNMDYRLKVMEEALSQGQLDLSSWDMFPKIVANAGYITRNKDQFSQSITQGSTTPNGTFSSGIDRNRTTASLEFSWNLLDFGVSYFRAKQLADQSLIAEERKRRVAQNMLQDLRNAYWRALGAQRLMTSMDETMTKATAALGRARQVEAQGLLPQSQALAYQRALLDATTLLQVRRQDLELSKIELMALMNIAPGTSFTIAEVTDPTLPASPSNIGQLEDYALLNRPELREEDYRKRVSKNEVYRQYLSILPGISFDYGIQRDSNKFLLNKSWNEGAFRISENLMKLATIPSMNRNFAAQKEVDEARRMAQAMAVLTQVRVASSRYGLAKDELDQVVESASVDQRLANYAKAAATARVDSELEVIRTDTRALLSSYQKHISYANAQAAWGRLYNSLGLDLMNVDRNMSLSQLTSSIEQSMSAWQRTTFGGPISGKPVMQSVKLAFTEATNPNVRAAIAKGLEGALKRHDIKIDPAAQWTMTAQFVADAAVSGTRRGTWQMTLTRPDGTIAGKTSYATVFPTDISSTAVQALTESAIDANSLAMTDWLGSPSSNLAGTLDRSVTGVAAN